MDWFKKHYYSKFLSMFGVTNHQSFIRFFPRSPNAGGLSLESALSLQIRDPIPQSDVQSMDSIKVIHPIWPAKEERNAMQIRVDDPVPYNCISAPFGGTE